MALSIPQLYRGILKAAKVYPSIRRDVIIKEIKVEFHTNKTETDPAKIEKMYLLAMQSLNQLEAYIQPKGAFDWEVQLTGGTNMLNGRSRDSLK
mmetsp:Transcript_24491/g.77428  ORF Transcript_24491/g.77428 Transcript_24491/m.77428 type:complete len:94 (+) Transcript_24491:275-556(+)